MSEQPPIDLVDALEAVVWAADPDPFRFRFVSRHAERLLGYPVERWLAEPDFWLSLVHPEDRDYASRSRRRAIELGKRCEFEYRMVARDGRIVWIHDTVSVTLAGPHPAALHGIMLDITEAKRTERALRHAAFHDPLTNLPNRKLFELRLEQAMKRARRKPEHHFAVLFMDVDHFKVINDSLGHLIGDRLLMETAARLTVCVRDCDTVARFGGDEFGILLEDLENPSHVLEIAGRIAAAVEQPFLLKEAEGFVPTASIGVAVGHSGYTSPKEVIRDADAALYRAKESGRRRVVIFDPSMAEELAAAGSLEAEMRQAFESGRFQLVYQEIRAASTGELAAFEAIPRWTHPWRGLLPPEGFSALAEESGLAAAIGWWVLEQSCAHLRRWREQAGSPLRLHVKLGAVQLAQADLVSRLAALLEAARLGAGAVNLEIPELVLMENLNALAGRMDQLKSLGLGLVVDEFGTGHLPLLRLQDVPLDFIKFDRRYLRGLRSAHAEPSFTEAVLSLARRLGVRTIAAGVETAEELALLRKLGCDFVQGAAVGAAAEPSAIAARLASERTRA
jgi:diguanylate cyclase (GGDEF)-like protein/PAS domain S-box-containing protein